MIIVSEILPSPSTLVVSLYCRNLKFATTLLLSSIVTLTEVLLPLASPDQLEKTYSALGAALRVTVLPSLKVPSEGKTVPLFGGFTLTSKMNSLVQPVMNVKNNKNFKRAFIYRTSIIKFFIKSL